MKACSVRVKSLHIPHSDMKRKWIGCGECPEDIWFYRSTNLHDHVLRNHSDPADWPFLCSFCNLTKTSRQYTIAHIRRFHPEEMEREKGVVDRRNVVSDKQSFERKMALMDQIQSTTVETWFWTLPSNRFMNFEEQTHFSRIRNQDLLTTFRLGNSTPEDCAENILLSCLPEELVHSWDNGEKMAL